MCALRAGAKLAGLKASGRIAAIPQGSRPPRPAAPRGPSRVCRPRASKCARPYCRAALHAPFGLTVISVLQIVRLVRPHSCTTLRAPYGLTVISVLQFVRLVRPHSRGRPRSDAKPCVLKHSGGLLSWRFLGCSRRDARLLRNSGRVKQSPPNRAAAPATAGLTRGREIDR